MQNTRLKTAIPFVSLLMLSSGQALAGGGGEPSDPGPNPNPDIFDVPGNLIKNGNFEFLDGSVGESNGRHLNDVSWRGWDLYQTIPHWFTSFGAGIEVQRSSAVYPQAEFGGGQYVELDSTEVNGKSSNSWMSQQVTGLSLGQTYQLDLLYHKNHSTGSKEQRGVAVYWGKHIPGKLACVLNAEDSEGEWKEMTCNVSANAESMYITFAAFGDESSGRWGNDLGGLIDFVRLTVPETP